MKINLEALWNEWLAEDCAKMDTEEERRCVRAAAEKHERAECLLTKEQAEAVEVYTDALCDIHRLLEKKAFFMGCELGVAFLQRACLSEED